MSWKPSSFLIKVPAYSVKCPTPMNFEKQVANLRFDLWREERVQESKGKYFQKNPFLHISFTAGKQLAVFTDCNIFCTGRIELSILLPTFN
jgi:hypothetical protein